LSAGSSLIPGMAFRATEVNFLSPITSRKL